MVMSHDARNRRAGLTMFEDKFSLTVTGLYAVLALIQIATLAHADPLSRSTMQRDAPTVRFYDSRGNVTGSASTYGNTTKFYAPDGKLVGSATNNGSARPLRQKGELSSSAISTLTKCRRSEE